LRRYTEVGVSKVAKERRVCGALRSFKIGKMVETQDKEE